MKNATLLVAFGALAAPSLGSAQPFRALNGTFIHREAMDSLAVSRHSGIEISFDNGQFEIRRDNESRTLGSYVVRGDTLVLADVRGAWACATPETATGTYLLRWRQEELQLSLVGPDRCNRRRNRFADAVWVARKAPAFAPTMAAPAELGEAWKTFWLRSDIPGWVDSMFTADASAEDGNRRLTGVEEIRGWLGGQDSRSPQAFPFEFSRSGPGIVEKGRYRDIFGSPDGSTRVLVGRYQITWIPSQGSWKVQQWILR